MPQPVSDVNQEAPWGWGESEPGPRPRQLSAATSASSPVSLTPSHISLHLLQCASASLHPSASSGGSSSGCTAPPALACSHSSGGKVLDRKLRVCMKGKTQPRRCSVTTGADVGHAFVLPPERWNFPQTQARTGQRLPAAMRDGVRVRLKGSSDQKMLVFIKRVN